MKKKYYKPYIIVEEMNTSLLEDVSNVNVGGTGTPDAKCFSSAYFEDEEYDE